MEAVNEALKLISKARSLLNQTDFVDMRNDLPGIAQEVESLLEKAEEILVKSK